MVKEVQSNPFRECVVGENFQKILRDRCMNKCGGLLFKLFDVGNMCFEEAKLLTYRNVVGSEVRKFLNVCCDRRLLVQSLENMKNNIFRVVRLAVNDEKFLSAFVDTVDDIIREFIVEIDNHLLSDNSNNEINNEVREVSNV